MAYEVVDFLDIVDAIREELKIQSGDTVSVNKIKRIVNRVHLQEVIPFTKWKWLEGSTQVVHKARYNTEYVTVTPNSTTVTLSTAPPAAQGSFAGKKFAVDGYNEIYIIESHVAESTTITLATEYTGNAGSTLGFKIWTDYVNLPTDCRETVGVYHNFSSKPMEGIGKQKFRQIVSLNPRAEAYPSFYFTGDFYDPTTGTDETESDRYRRLSIHPAINRTDCTLSIDYVKEITPLTDDADEPVMPVEDRSVLVDGALARLWKSMASDNDNAMMSKQDYESKLARMAGKIEDSQDIAKVLPTSTYVRSMRAPRLRPGSHSSSGLNGGSGYTAVTYLDNPTIKGAIITDDVTVSTGVTIDGVDISELDTDFTAHLADTADAHDASAISFVPAGTVVSTDIQAAITELDANKVAGSGSSTDNAIARFDGSGGATLQNSAVTVDDSGNMTQASGVTHAILTSSTLADNTAVAAAVFSLAYATYTTAIVEYSLSRGAGNREVGHIYMVTDGTTANFTTVGTSMGTLGVTFTADISGSDMRLLYTTTSTGTAASMNYILRKWLL